MTPSTQEARATHGWAHVDQERKREIIAAIASGEATQGPVHAELDLTDRCNVACYFCNQMDVRTKDQICFARVTEIIDELAGAGLRSVRLSGGGDPLVHREILPVLDHLAARGVVVDNLTTNGALLGPEIASRLVAGGAREVVFSLNAVDREDYFRMMAVKPATFDAVLANIRHLVALRGERPSPAVVVQFLIDRANFRQLPRMYELGRSLGADKIAVNPVLEIPLERIEGRLLLGPRDWETVRPCLEEILRRDAGESRLQLCFPWPEWNQKLAVLERSIGAEPADPYPSAPSFNEKENGHCFFGWYTMTVRGNGDLYPCCMLMNPGYKPLGNALEGSMIRDHWQGGAFARLRREMREVFLTKGRLFQRRGRFQHLLPQCIVAHQCALKNMYFRQDEGFYRELDQALSETRRREVRWFGRPEQIRRAAEVFAFRAYHGLRVRSQPLRSWLWRSWNRIVPIQRRKSGLYLNVGSGARPLAHWVNIDIQKLPGVDVVADITSGLRFRDARAVFAEHFLEHLPVERALDFLEDVHRSLAPEGWIRLSTPNLEWVWATHYRPAGEGEEKAEMGVRLNRAFYGWRHRFLWNRELLTRALEACGFVGVRWCRYGESELEFFRGLEQHETYGDREDLPHVLIAEATRGAPQPERLAAFRDFLKRELLDHLRD
jgi:MoaA/NifB/PqqE/SkfB family radical SAM enzyme